MPPWGRVLPGPYACAERPTSTVTEPDEEVRVRVRPPPFVRERMRIESDLSSGGRVHGFLGSGGLGYALEAPIDADRDGDDEVGDLA